MAEIEKLNIYQKLQKSRVELQNKKLKKNGKNTYSGYEYFELGDFLPQINEVCLNNGLAPIFHFESEKATLTVTDCDDPTSTLIFPMPIDVATLKGCSNIQNIGGTQTYARRYLYMMAFEVAESDFIENTEEDKDGPNAKIDDIKISTIYDLIKKTNTDISEFLKYAKAKKVEDLTNKKFAECMRLLNKKVADLEKANKKTESEQIEF